MIIKNIKTSILLITYLLFSGCYDNNYIYNDDYYIDETKEIVNIKLDNVDVNTAIDLHYDDYLLSCVISFTTIEYDNYDLEDFYEGDVGNVVIYENQKSWLNIKSPYVLSTMQDRIAMASELNCDIITFVDVDIYNYDSGFINTNNDVNNYIDELIYTSHNFGIPVIGLNIELFDNFDLLNKFDLILE